MAKFKSAPSYIKFFQSKSVRQFTNREAVYLYLENEVFINQDFINNVRETATTREISYLLAYELITNFLTDTLYEIDIAICKQKKKTRIRVFSYFHLDIGFMMSFKNKKMFLEKYIY